MTGSELLNTASTLAVAASWFVYLPMFIGKSGPGTERTRKNRLSQLGIALQVSSVAIIWIWKRELFSPLGSMPFPVISVAPVVAVILAWGSVWFSWLALKTLGKQWSLVAGVTSQHRLIQDGPYAVVRHPLYVCFFGQTLATAMVWSRPLGMAVAVVLFWAGVSIRVLSEETVLRETFGAEFDRYAARVPRFIPKLLL